MADRREPPELPLHLLADLDAGLLDPPRAAAVRGAAAEDPDAAAALTGLAATRRDLGELADPPVPPEFAARWDAALAAEADAAGGPAGPSTDGPGDPAPHTTDPAGPGSGPAGPQSADQVDPAGHPVAGPGGRPSAGGPGRHRSAADRRAGPSAAPVRPPRAGRRRRPRPALLAAAVLAAALAGGLLWTPPAPAPPSPDGVDLVAEALAARGDLDVGGLAEPARRAACLRATAPPGVSPDAALLGGRDVVVDGRAGVLLLLAAGGPGRLHVVVVDPACGPDGGTLLAAQAIGG